MDDISSTTFGIFDHYGLFVAIAQRLAESGARVVYATPIDRRDAINEAVIGDGFAFHWTDDLLLWNRRNRIDTFVFPDIRHQGMQAYLRDQGKAVWGSQGGMRLEQDRQFFLRMLKELGLDVPPHEEVVGLSNLAAFLKDKKDIFIKVSKWRGTWETFHWKSWEENWKNIDDWAVKWGGLKEYVHFLCFEKIDTDLEIGADTYCVDGNWPETLLHGIERKNKAYFSAVTKWKDMPEQLTIVMEAFSPYLRGQGYRNQWSMENRVKGKKNYFNDATTRGGLPSTNSFLAAKNIPEVIYHGARGQMVQIDYGYKFSCECAVEMEDTSDSWGTAVLNEEIREKLLAQQCCEIGGQLWFPPSGHQSGHIGWLRTTGDTPTQCFKEMNQLADELPDGCSAAVEDLAHAIKEVESEMDQGLPFTEAPLPDPAIVLE